MHAGIEYYHGLSQQAIQNRNYSKIPMPVLAYVTIGGNSYASHINHCQSIVITLTVPVFNGISTLPLLEVDHWLNVNTTRKRLWNLDLPIQTK